MGEEKKKKKLSRLKNKFRLVIMNDDTFEEKTSLVLSPLNVFVLVGSVILFLIVAVIYVIAFTPLREYIPGYADVNMRKNIMRVTLKADSLEQQLIARDAYIENFKNIVNGNLDGQPARPQKDSSKQYNHLNVSASSEDLALRQEIESRDKYSLSLNGGGKNSINSFFFFNPLNGVVTNSFNEREQHFGVDITGPKDEAIKATLDGTVIFAEWTSKTGYVIQVQHNNNSLVSIYKHNSALLKKPGEKVKAGEAIAIIGDSGELSTGPHVHFELWYNGIPVDPQEYIVFNQGLTSQSSQ